MRKKPKLISQGIQCNGDLEDSQHGIIRQPLGMKLNNKDEKENSPDFEYTTPPTIEETSNGDPDFEPISSDECLSDRSTENENYQPWKEKKFIVFESKLLELFQSCPSCAACALFNMKKTIGSMVRIEQTLWRMWL